MSESVEDQKLTAIDVALLMLAQHAESFPDVRGMDEQKLHFLVYFAQGHWLGVHGTPLFDDPIIAGPNGPWIPSLEALRPKGHVF
ncbi:hypothetical protein SAMN04489743_2828 [Pseudarthrobacter equi]|uniref:Antitoxin SocA-like Panacea domain-containing protein n=1 Tax=Pseudarthrobacter equi TaxID=728066 RepID=A0A1H2A7K3_9MICC|nr:hypothetical protein [Pseudarthrobacter equi]SDT41854.1 hypothetical protein SAMN04489743_2828 [Pseudarthrobacter equi]